MDCVDGMKEEFSWLKDVIADAQRTCRESRER